MDSLLQYWQNEWAAYPPWVGFCVLAVGSVLLFWFLAKVFAWFVKLLLIGAAVFLVLGVLVHFLA